MLKRMILKYICNFKLYISISHYLYFLCIICEKQAEIHVEMLSFQYLLLARTLKFYGHIQFRRCVCDYPQPNTTVTVSAGGRELVFHFDTDPVSTVQVAFFFFSFFLLY